MRVYWRYQCDYGHEWVRFRDADAEEQLADTRCPTGHEAVTLHKAEPIDEVQITLRPAGFKADNVTGRMMLQGRYWLVICDLATGRERVSERTCNWQEALRLAECFRGHSREQAWWRMDRFNEQAV